jgi:hypothetical protein
MQKTYPDREANTLMSRFVWLLSVMTGESKKGLSQVTDF